METNEIIKKAVLTWSAPVQIYKAVEELNELAVELMHWNARTNNYERVVDEVADVAIMIMQLRHIFSRTAVDEQIDKKMARLEKLLSQLP